MSFFFVFKVLKFRRNAYHTLIVARLAFETTEKKLRREFEQFGPIKCVKMVLDNDGKPRGYAFLEFEREEDMTSAYKRSDGKKIDGRRILVDVERGRYRFLIFHVFLSLELFAIGDPGDLVVVLEVGNQRGVRRRLLRMKFVLL